MSEWIKQNSEWVVPIVAAAISALISGAAGYKIGIRQSMRLGNNSTGSQAVGNIRGGRNG